MCDIDDMTAGCLFILMYGIEIAHYKIQHRILANTIRINQALCRNTYYSYDSYILYGNFGGWSNCEWSTRLLNDEEMKAINKQANFFWRLWKERVIISFNKFISDEHWEFVGNLNGLSGPECKKLKESKGKDNLD